MYLYCFNQYQKYLCIIFSLLFLGGGLCHTNTVKVIWRLSNLNGGGRPQVPLRALFQVQEDTWVEHHQHSLS